MSMTDNDPLRFLKPRKKQFHLTPTKNHSKLLDQSELSILGKSSELQYAAQITKTEVLKEQNKPKEADIDFILRQTEQTTQKLNTIIQNNSFKSNPKAQYNPLKYFSQAVEDFLSQKSTNPAKPKPNYGFEQSFGTYERANKSIFNDVQKRPTENRNRFFETQTTEKHPQPIKKSQRASKNSEVSQSINFPEESMQQSKVQSNKFTKQKDQKQVSKNQKEQKIEQHPELQEEQLSSQGAALKKCDTCGRSFNPNSYEKHVKVCEKVFFQKRKQFSSEKQRSLSKKK